MGRVSRATGGGRKPKELVKVSGVLESVIPPVGLINQDATDMWNQQSQILIERELLTTDQLPLLMSYCNSFAVMRMADDNIAAYGVVVDSATGVKKNPSIMVRSSAIAEMKSVGSFFGFDPISHTRINGKKEKESDEPNPFDQF